MAQNNRNAIILQASLVSFGSRLQKGADPAKAAGDSFKSGVLFADAFETGMEGLAAAEEKAKAVKKPGK